MAYRLYTCCLWRTAPLQLKLPLEALTSEESLHWLHVHQHVTVLTNWQLYASRQDRHWHQGTFSHCSYHTSPLDHCGQATHRGWPFLEQFCQPCFLYRCTDRLEITAGQCRQLRTPWQLLNSDWKLTFFTASYEMFLPPSASVCLIMALYKFLSFIHSLEK